MSLVKTTTLTEPAGGLLFPDPGGHRQPPCLHVRCTGHSHGNKKENTGDDLEKEGNAPNGLICGVFAIAAEVGVVDPEREGNAGDNKELVHASKAATNVFRRTLGDVLRGCRGQQLQRSLRQQTHCRGQYGYHTDTKAANRSSDIELVQGSSVALSARRTDDLEKRTKEKYGSSDEERWPSSEFFGEEHARQGALWFKWLKGA
jgi:hypothetical protein